MLYKMKKKWVGHVATITIIIVMLTKISFGGKAENASVQPNWIVKSEWIYDEKPDVPRTLEVVSWMNDYRLIKNCNVVVIKNSRTNLFDPNKFVAEGSGLENSNSVRTSNVMLVGYLFLKNENKMLLAFDGALESLIVGNEEFRSYLRIKDPDSSGIIYVDIKEESIEYELFKPIAM